MHRTDRLTAAVQPGQTEPEVFKQRYQALLQHYGLRGQAINARQAHENGNAEQSHHQLKRRLEQELLLRGSQDFPSRDAYLAFLRQVYSGNSSTLGGFSNPQTVWEPLGERG
jgi:hypothetical protein